MTCTHLLDRLQVLSITHPGGRKCTEQVWGCDKHGEVTMRKVRREGGELYKRCSERCEDYERG